MIPRAALIVVAITGLAGCDAATQIAGDAVQGEARSLMAAQCQQVSESAGIVAGRVAEVCECATDTFVAQRDFNPTNINRGRVEAIVNDCAKRTSSAGGAAPTEEAGG
jgi:hypothetical protein